MDPQAAFWSFLPGLAPFPLVPGYLVLGEARPAKAAIPRSQPGKYSRPR